MNKGTPIQTKFGTLHVGDIIKARLYEKNGREINNYIGELVYHADEARFLILDPPRKLSFNLNFAEKPEVVKKWDADLRWFTSSCGRIEFQMTIQQAQSVCHPGQCDSDVLCLSNMPEIKAITDKLDPDEVKIVIGEAYGDITDEELNDHEQNIQRLLWIAGCDIDEREPIEDDDSMVICNGCNETVKEHGYCNKDGSAFGDCCWGEHADKCESCKEDISNA